MDPAKVLSRVLAQRQVALVLAVLDVYGRAAGGLLANGLAFAALFATIPTALVALGLAGWIVADPAIRDALIEALSEAFPPLASLFEGALSALSSGSAVVSIIGVIGLIWTVSQFYGALDTAFARIFAASPERDVVQRTLRGFIWVGLIAAVVIGWIVVGLLTSVIASAVPAALPLADSLSSLMGSPPVLIGFAILVVILVYRTLPPTTPRWGSIVLPAVVVGVAIAVLAQIFGFIAPRLVGVAALAGSLGAAFIALAWLAFTFQALLYGAAWVRIRDEGMPNPDAGTAGEPVSAGLGSPTAPTEPGGGGE